MTAAPTWPGWRPQAATTGLYGITLPDGTFTAGQTSLPRFSHNGLRTWRWLDVDGDGRTDLVHVQCEILAQGQPCILRVDVFVVRR